MESKLFLTIAAFRLFKLPLFSVCDTIYSNLMVSLSLSLWEPSSAAASDPLTDGKKESLSSLSIYKCDSKQDQVNMESRNFVYFIVW